MPPPQFAPLTIVGSDTLLMDEGNTSPRHGDPTAKADLCESGACIRLGYVRGGGYPAIPLAPGPRDWTKHARLREREV